jgi:hypothetical protein
MTTPPPQPREAEVMSSTQHRQRGPRQAGTVPEPAGPGARTDSEPTS